MWIFHVFLPWDSASVTIKWRQEGGWWVGVGAGLHSVSSGSHYGVNVHWPEEEETEKSRFGWREAPSKKEIMRTALLVPDSTVHIADTQLVRLHSAFWMLGFNHTQHSVVYFEALALETRINCSVSQQTSNYTLLREPSLSSSSWWSSCQHRVASLTFNLGCLLLPWAGNKATALGRVMAPPAPSVCCHH